MATALIMGITGGFGGEVAEVLRHEGWSLRALLRDPSSLPERFACTETVVGDAANPEDVRRAADGVGLIVYGVNAPYHQWQDKVVPMLDVTANVAEQIGATIVFPGNVYAFDPALGSGFGEKSAEHPPTQKGRLRQQMEQRLRQAAANGARVLIIRCGDFIGRHAPSTWMQHMIRQSGSNVRVFAPGHRELVHTWAYLPDVARTVGLLLRQADRLDAFEVFHYRGIRASVDDIAHAINEVSGCRVKVKPYPWWALRLVSPFVPFMKSLMEMRYLWQYELNLADDKLRGALDAPVPQTPLGQALLDSGLVSAPSQRSQQITA